MGCVYFIFTILTTAYLKEETWKVKEVQQKLNKGAEDTKETSKLKV